MRINSQYFNVIHRRLLERNLWDLLRRKCLFLCMRGIMRYSSLSHTSRKSSISSFSSYRKCFSFSFSFSLLLVQMCAWREKRNAIYKPNADAIGCRYALSLFITLWFHGFFFRGWVWCDFMFILNIRFLSVCLIILCCNKWLVEANLFFTLLLWWV